jgi:hypothetical protein
MDKVQETAFTDYRSTGPDLALGPRPNAARGPGLGLDLVAQIMFGSGPGLGPVQIIAIKRCIEHFGLSLPILLSQRKSYS